MDERSVNRDKYAKLLASLVKESYSVRVHVYGLSMFPFFLPGDEVFVVNIQNKKPKIGDVIFFHSRTGIVAHRILKIYEKEIVTKGDGLLKKDTPISFDDVLGVVVMHFRKKHEIIYSKNKRFNKTVAFFSPLIGIISFPLARIWNKYIR